jgi:signal transduction histidine kinase
VRYITKVDNPLLVSSHPVLLGEVVNILLDKACHYSGDGSRITLVLSQVDGEARLEVTDHGHGIAEADLPHIFTPFFRTREALRANKNGVGLCLSIAHRLMQAIGGSIRANSQVGAGSRFTMIVSKCSNHE